MKYLIPPILLLLTAGAVYSTYLLFPAEFEDCCEWVGLIAPEGVSEVPGVAHADLPDALEDGSIPQDLPGLKLGDAPGEITLTGLDDRQVTVDFSGAELTAIVWVSMKCPTSLVYEERLNELEQEFPNVQWVAINSSAREGMADLRNHYRDGDENRLRMRVLKDEGNVIADRFGVSVTTEVFIFKHAKLEYRGAIDDARNPRYVEEEYVRRVVESLTDGREPQWRFQPPRGCCPIDRVTAEDLAAEAAANTSKS